MIQITKPLIAFDTETTNAIVHEARIVEISTIKVYPDGKSSKKTWRINPECEIHPKATEVHGISNEDVKDCPTFKQVAIQIYNEFSDAGHILTYNGDKFDIPILYRQLQESGIDWNPGKCDLIDLYKIIAKLNPRDLSSMVMKYLGIDHSNAHEAEADTVATMKLLRAIVSQHPEAPKDASELSIWANDGKQKLDIMGVFYYNEENRIAFSGGKHKDEVVDVSLHRSYLEWQTRANNPPFMPDTIRIVNEFLNLKQ